jgi:peptidoglycan/LPS O-acetylase OafA/YrhL
MRTLDNASGRPKSVSVGTVAVKDAPTQSFRTDIEGLRGLAVMAVLGFHLEFAGLPGGFVGVDIFFVISGFLMTQIIGRRLNEGSFKIWQFYGGRILRIWPAMFVLIGVALLLGALSLFPADLLKLARAAIASLLLYNNFLFAYEVGYFDGTAVNNVLLHLWSLGVEQQFYIFMPFLMLLVGPYGDTKKWRALLIPAALAVSLALCVVASPAKPIPAFYLLPTRFWEFLCGAIVAIWAFQFRLDAIGREFAAFVGLALIVIAIACFNKQMVFPAYWAILPVAGSALIIAAGTTGSTFVSKFLSISAIRMVGRLSYSLYLWHWPIIVFARLRGFAIDDASMQGVILVLSFAAAYLSWRYIELPFWHGGVFSRANSLRALAGVAVVLIGGGAAVVATGGLPGRLGQSAHAYETYATYPQRAALYREGACFLPKGAPAEQFDLAACSNIGPGKINLLLWGDSLAADLTPGLMHDENHYNVGFTQATYGGCAPPRVDSSATCHKFGDRILRLAAEGDYAAVVLSADWVGYPGVLFKLQQLVLELRDMKRAVVIIGPRMQYQGGLPSLLASREFGILPSSTTTRNWLYKPSLSLDAEMHVRFSGMPGVSYFSPLNALCPHENCPVLLAGGVPLFWDGAHLTKEGSEFFVPRLLDAIIPTLKQSSTTR